METVSKPLSCIVSLLLFNIELLHMEAITHMILSGDQAGYVIYAFMRKSFPYQHKSPVILKRIQIKIILSRMVITPHENFKSSATNLHFISHVSNYLEIIFKSSQVKIICAKYKKHNV